MRRRSRIATGAVPDAAFEHHHRAERRLDRHRLVGIGRCWISTSQVAARHHARAAVLGGEFIETPRHVHALWRRGPRLRNENLIGVQHAGVGTRTDDVRRQIAEQRGPANHGADQAQRGRMLHEFGENRIPVQHVPYALIGVAVVEAETRLLAPLRAIVGGRRV